MASSDRGEREAGARNIDFGVMTMSGVLAGRSTWARSRWKYCAAVEGWVTRRLPRAQSDKKRSMRAELCSGPCPS